MKIEKKDLPKGLVELKIVIDEKEFASYHAKAFSVVQQAVEVDGFRKGNAPEDLIVKKYGDMVILEEMANLALRDAYVKAVEEQKLNPISEPQVTITKIAKGNPLELTITVPVMPELILPSYKKIAKDAVTDGEKIEVSDKDIEDVLEELRKGRATQHAHVDEAKSEEDVESQQASTQINHDHSHESHDHPTSPGGSAGQDSHEGRDHSHAQHDHTHEEKNEGDVAVLPELDDTFAQSFGGDFKTLADLKTKVGENLKLEKEQKLREKRRTAIMEKLVSESKADLPDVIVEGELNNMLTQMKADITRFGGTWEDYLTHSKKTEEEMKKDWLDDAHKRAMSQLLLHKIAQAEKLIATEEEVEVELVRLLATVQDADEERAKAYLYQALTNEKVLKFLEESK
jgi:trigger factor